MNSKDRTDYYKKYYLKNREKILSKREPYQQKYRDEHKDEKKTYDENYRIEKRQYIRNRNFVYRTFNKEQINAKRRDYYHNVLKTDEKFIQRKLEKRDEINAKNLARYHRNKKVTRTLNRDNINQYRRDYYHNVLKKDERFIKRKLEKREEINAKNLARYHRNKKVTEKELEEEKLKKKLEKELKAKLNKKSKHQLQIEREQRYHKKLIELYEKNDIFKI